VPSAMILLVPRPCFGSIYYISDEEKTKKKKRTITLSGGQTGRACG